MKIKLRSIGPFALAGMLMCSCSSADDSAQNTAQSEFASAVAYVCAEVPVRYAYYASRAGHWPDACLLALADASSAKDGAAKLAVLERLVDDLYDPHVSLNTNNQYSPRLVPSGSDLHFMLQDNAFTVAAVRPASGAANAGVEIGDRLFSFNGVSPEVLALTRIHAGRGNIDSDRRAWAVNAAIAGRRAELREIVLERGGKHLSFNLGAPDPNYSETPVSFRMLSDKLGYIRINNSLGDEATPAAFNDALEHLRNSSGLVLDLRGTPSGGDTRIAEPILSRFFERATPYQVTAPIDAEPYVRSVPLGRDWTYSAPLIVLVGRWTGSMGEGMGIGLDGADRALVMGSAMAGLAGGTEPIDIPGFDVSLWIPVYDLHHLNGTPRHLWRPHEIQIADNGNGPDLLLGNAMTALEQQIP